MTKRIDRFFRGVGRYAKTPQGDRAGVSNMLTDLHRGPRRDWDVLRAICDNRLDVEYVYERYRRGRILPTADEMLKLTDAVERWLPSVKNHYTRTSYAWALDRVAGSESAGSDSTLAELPAVLATYRTACETADTARTFNLTRAASQALVRDTLGRGSSVWEGIRSLRPLPLTRRIGAAQTPTAIHTYAAALGAMGPNLWDLCLSGMRRGEYFGRRWELADDRIVVNGTKTAGSVRPVPRTRDVAPPNAGYDHFAHSLRRVSGGLMRVHDARKTFAHWCEEAGVSRTRIRLYLGHGRRDTTDIYTEMDVRPWLRPDAERLQTYVMDQLRTHVPTHNAPIAQLVEQMTLNHSSERAIERLVDPYSPPPTHSDSLSHTVSPTPLAGEI